MRRHLRIFPFRALFNRISRLVRSCYLRWAMNNNEREYILNVSINARGSGVTILANNATGNDGCVDDGSDVGGSDDGDGTGKREREKKECIKNGRQRSRRRNGRDSARPSDRFPRSFLAWRSPISRVHERFHTNDRRVLDCTGVDRSARVRSLSSLNFPHLCVMSVSGEQ